MIKVGFAVRVITPTLGLEIPGLFEQRFAQGVADDLFARAVVVEDGARVIVLVQVDAIVVPENVVAEARKAITKLCAIPGSACFIAATHTHSGGPLFGSFLSEADSAYGAFVAAQIASAVAQAYRARRPSLVGVDAVAAPGFAFNRRFVMKHGGQQTHPGKDHPGIVEAAGPEDPTVTVIGFRDPENHRPTGCVVTFACHSTHMNGVLYSADYARWIVHTLRSVYGRNFGVVFLNGASGDVTQVNNRSGRPMELGPHWCERTGRGVGGAAITALSRMDMVAMASVDVGRVKVTASIRTSTTAQRHAAQDLLKARAITAEDVETIYANELLEVEKLRRRSKTRKLELMGVRIADAFLWGVPSELFQALALQVRGGSPFAHTCCVALANGYNGYICTEEAFAGGGYEVRTARSSFLDASAGRRVVTGGLRLAKRMHAAADQELKVLPARRTWPDYEDAQSLDGINQLVRKGE